MTAVIRRATVADLDAIAAFASRSLQGGPPERYRRVFEYAWLADKPDLGVLLDDNGTIRGFLGAIYSDRRLADRTIRCCNLTSIAVEPAFRAQTLRMFGELLRRKDITYTCFSASKEVEQILQFFKFQHCPSERVIATPMSGLSSLRNLLASPRIRVRAGRAAIESLSGEQRELARHHAAYRCAVLSIERGADRCLVIAIRRGRGIQSFADVLYASNHEMLVDALPWLQLPLARALGTVLTGLDARHVQRRPWPSAAYTKLRATHVRSSDIGLDEVDALYSELVVLNG